MVQETRTKEAVLTRHGIAGAVWIETGTYLGETTEFLARSAKQVFSIEPGGKLFADAEARFKNHRNVKIINGLSEQVLPWLLHTITGDVCFWLDGHYTDESTYRGPLDTPIEPELAAIAEHVGRWSNTVVLIDDAHLFTGKKHVYGVYPTLAALEAWAEKHLMTWHTESDIFVCRTNG